MEKWGVIQTGALVSQRNAEDFLRRVPISPNDGLRQKRGFAQCFSKAQRLKYLDGIRRDLNASADLAESTRALEDAHVESTLCERTRQGHASYTPADHPNPKFPSHLASSPCMLDRPGHSTKLFGHTINLYREGIRLKAMARQL
jgi:hypothetical protein